MTITPELITAALGEAPNTNCMFGMRCPNPDCLSTGPFLINGYIWDDNGCDDSNEGWTPKTDCRCCQCEHAGMARDFDDPVMNAVTWANAQDLLTWAQGLPPISTTLESNLDVVAYRMAHLMLLEYMRGRSEAYDQFENGQTPEMVAYAQIRRILLNLEGIC